MKTDKWYWKVYVKRPLWKRVDRKRKGDNLKWTQLVEKMFETYLHGVSVEPLQTHIPLPKTPPTGQQTYTGIQLDPKHFKTFESKKKVKNKGWKVIRYDGKPSKPKKKSKGRKKR